MIEAPTGTVTLLFTDIEGSTRLLQRVGDAYADLLAGQFAGHLDRNDAERAARIGRAPGQPATSVLDPEEWLDQQAKLARINGDRERLEEIARARAEWDAQASQAGGEAKSQDEFANCGR